jgi:hypothetical protein
VATKTERLYGILLAHPKATWSQRELSARAGCSTGYTSRVVASLVSMGVLARPYKNRVILVGPTKLLTLWAARRSLPEPSYVTAERSLEEVEASLRGAVGAALTLFRAAWHRTKFLRTETLEAYAPRGDLPLWISRLGAPSVEPTPITLYPTDGAELEGLERVQGLPLVSVPQTYVDLMAIGGQGPRVAAHLARTTGLLEV